MKAPSVRLAAGGHDNPTRMEHSGILAPAVRLSATRGGGTRDIERSGLLGSPSAPSVRLAHLPGTPGDRALKKPAFETNLPELKPSILIAYPYLAQFMRRRADWRIREWVMDSGAFTVANSGGTIDLKAYIDTCKRLLAEDPQLAEVFALDVIGDWQASARNADAMVRAGVPAIPCYHIGEPWSALKALCAHHPKVAIGGTVGRSQKERHVFFTEVFARVWPKRLHGFGVCDEKTMMKFPWHTVDASSWQAAPTRFGVWKSYGGAKLNIRGSDHNLRSEVAYYLGVERRARARWASTWEGFKG